MQPDLLHWRAAETIDGPRPDSAIRARKPATPPDYTAQWCAFVATDAGHAKLLGDVAGVVPVSHNWTAPAADWLVTMEPRLGAVIERRKRTAAKAVAP